jgi:hypothetical protein
MVLSEDEGSSWNAWGCGGRLPTPDFVRDNWFLALSTVSGRRDAAVALFMVTGYNRLSVTGQLRQKSSALSLVDQTRSRQRVPPVSFSRGCGGSWCNWQTLQRLFVRGLKPPAATG